MSGFYIFLMNPNYWHSPLWNGDAYVKEAVY
jgi:hypothetical protein